jgi:dimeric dUTPase (all-alpha-NTP-PPase superfamily)
VNFKSLFESQHDLDLHIEEQHNLQSEDLFERKVLAALVELAECANEYRGFKFWKINQEPVTFKPCRRCHGKGKIHIEPYVICPVCEGEQGTNPLLEEYVDKFHFLLSLGLEMEYDLTLTEFKVEKRESITKQFINLFYLTSTFTWFNNFKLYQLLIGNFVGLGEMLGFTWEQIEQAYYSKNQVNHERQESGY